MAKINMIGDYKKAFVMLLNKVSYGKSMYQVFGDFCTMARLSLMQPFYRSPELEKEYMSIVSRYSKKEANELTLLLSYVVLGLEANPLDFLGRIYMDAGMGNVGAGEFFTPSGVAELMAKMVSGDIKAQLKGKDFLMVGEPAAGAGGMVLAYAKEARAQGVNPAISLWFDCWDTSYIPACMCYIQMALMNLPGRVVQGNALSQEIYQTWLTPAYFLFNWQHRLKKRFEGGEPPRFEQLTLFNNPSQNKLKELYLP